jgi:hypothetical protein
VNPLLAERVQVYADRLYLPENDAPCCSWNNVDVWRLAHEVSHLRIRTRLECRFAGEKEKLP